MNSPHGPSLPTIAGFTVDELIDTGGFSRVYRATQHGLDRPVAVKVLNSTLQDERQQRVFERECKVMGRLSNHPGIVTVYAPAFTEEMKPCIVMELYRGTFRNQGVLDVKQVVDVGAKLADALDAIHEEGIVHRDIKPHNVFISDRGEPAIGDFGISSVETERTVTGAGGFSVNYAPPEVFEEGGAEAPGDIYALGATLYQLATGEVPFPHTGPESDRLRATVHKIITAPPPSLRVDGAPESLDRLLRRCMAKRPEDRPGSARQVADELRRIQQVVGFPDAGALRQQTASTNTTQPTSDTPADGTVDRRAAQPTNNRTVLRDPKPRPDPSAVEPAADDEEVRAASSTQRRRLLIGAGVGLSVIFAGVLAVTLGGGGDDAATSTTGPTTSRPAAALVSLSPPTGVTVSRDDAGAFVVEWEPVDDSSKYQISEIGSGDSRLVEGSSYAWVSESSSSSGCFEIRTVDSAETRVSQAASAPACAS